MKKCKLYVEVEYDEEITDPDELAGAMDIVLAAILARNRELFVDYGNPVIGRFNYIRPEEKP